MGNERVSGGGSGEATREKRRLNMREIISSSVVRPEKKADCSN